MSEKIIYCGEKEKETSCLDLVWLMPNEYGIAMDYETFINMIDEKNESFLFQMAKNIIDVARAILPDHVDEINTYVIYTVYESGVSTDVFRFKAYLLFHHIEHHLRSDLAKYMTIMELFEYLVETDEESSLYHANENREKLVILAYANTIPKQILHRLMTHYYQQGLKRSGDRK